VSPRGLNSQSCRIGTPTDTRSRDNPCAVLKHTTAPDCCTHRMANYGSRSRGRSASRPPHDRRGRLCRSHRERGTRRHQSQDLSTTSQATLRYLLYSPLPRTTWFSQKAAMMTPRQTASCELMMILVAAFVLMLATTAHGQPSPVPLGPGGTCPYGWAAVGSYCQPPPGAQGAVPVAPGGGCPYGWAAVGSYCQRPPGAQGAVPVAPGGGCPYGWAGVGSYCLRPQGAQDAAPIGPNGSCPYGWAASGAYCIRPGGLRR
jgi:hypothetical protein